MWIEGQLPGLFKRGRTLGEQQCGVAADLVGKRSHGIHLVGLPSSVFGREGCSWSCSEPGCFVERSSWAGNQEHTWRS